MSETVKIWLNKLYDNEIRETEGAIENEEIWAKGADTEEQEAMHRNNISDLKEYKDVLSQEKAKIN
jgi:hypothetical protein